METHVISLRLPSAADVALARSAVAAGSSVPGALDWLLRNSFANCQLLMPLADSPDVWDAKLDVRVPARTFEQLRSATASLGIPVSVYIRKLLYHFYLTKRLRYVGSNGHYTLAGRHD
jgi:hypothetical protein